MTETMVDEKEIVAFIGPIKELLMEQAGKKVIVIGVGDENRALAKTIYEIMDASATSEIVAGGSVPTLNACLFGGNPDIVIIVTNHNRENERSKAAGLAVGLIATKTGHTQIVGAVPGSQMPATDTLASRTIIISTSGEIEADHLKSVGGGVVNLGELDSSKKFAAGLKKITGDE